MELAKKFHCEFARIAYLDSAMVFTKVKLPYIAGKMRGCVVDFHQFSRSFYRIEYQPEEEFLARSDKSPMGQGQSFEFIPRWCILVFHEGVDNVGVDIKWQLERGRSYSRGCCQFHGASEYVV